MMRMVMHAIMVMMFMFMVMMVFVVMAMRVMLMYMVMFMFMVVLMRMVMFMVVRMRMRMPIWHRLFLLAMNQHPHMRAGNAALCARLCFQNHTRDSHGVQFGKRGLPLSGSSSRRAAVSISPAAPIAHSDIKFSSV